MRSRIRCRLGVALAMVFPAAAIAGPLDPTGQWTANQRGDAPLPPMGWSSWNAFHTDITEENILASADVLVRSQLAAKGYRYIDIDDGWWLKRRQPDGRIIIRTVNFPSAVMPDGNPSFRPLTDKLHAMGLKAGIYSDIGRNSCSQVFDTTAPNQPEGSVIEREIGLYGHVDQDIRLSLGEWGFDLIKVDGCGIRGLPASNPKVQSGLYRAFPPLIDADSLARTDVAAVRLLYGDVADAVARVRPDGHYVYSLCLWGSADVRAWGKDLGSVSRTSEDLSPTWGRMLHNLDTVSRRELYGHPNSWNDADMLFVGSGDFDENHLTEARSHFALWAMVNSPLIIGYDLRHAAPALIHLFGNARVIAVNQDLAGNQATIVFDSDEVQIFVKTLSDGRKAVALFNRSGLPVDATLTAEHLSFTDADDVELTDLWSGATSQFRKERDVHLAPRQTVIFTAHGTRQLPGGLYLAEQPGSVNPAVDGVEVPTPDPLVHRAPLPWLGTHHGGDFPRYGGWGGTRVGRTPYDQPPMVAGQPLSHTIGVLANSRLEVRNAGFSRFSMRIGVDDSTSDRKRSVTFSIYGDGHLLARSRPMRVGDGAQSLTANVAGVKIVELVTVSDGTGGSPISADWGEAALTR
ncbi:NPCBM/NEW2 domain-containing protein [Polymorphobacter sp. PAMC 29334]|uniref:NPCBM/NEW2 domain-containing protein n=1 Tax=Polymorphobacter sp. PAMC 29334 TaxID=2862331 RepID=UPI001C77DD62|nr:NPCBM/NEW2 domain-containing protein [Polymorphobacter sp. PAMC 29334]QYE33915.1 NPCBM/NEW2 domain-containing protein [Polymorphobacter sp. PAMC 29334]